MKYREIAARIAQLASQYPTEPEPLCKPVRTNYAYTAGAEFRAAVELYEIERKERPQPIEVFRDGSFVVRCLPYRETIERVAAKFERGDRKAANVNSKLTRHTSLKRPKDADALLAALLVECGDTSETQELAAPAALERAA